MACTAAVVSLKPTKRLTERLLDTSNYSQPILNCLMCIDCSVEIDRRMMAILTAYPHNLGCSVAPRGRSRATSTCPTRTSRCTSSRRGTRASGAGSTPSTSPSSGSGRPFPSRTRWAACCHTGVLINRGVTTRWRGEISTYNLATWWLNILI